MWLYGTSEYDPNRILIYDYKLNRSGKNPSQFLKDYSGYLVCDGYNGYDNLQMFYYYLEYIFLEFFNPVKISIYIIIMVFI